MSTPIEIPLNSPINTKDDGLLSQEPAFERKNSLVFKGVASNITYSQGEGVLSTTGKHLYVDENNTIHAGEQSFTIPDNSYTVQDITSNEIGTEEVAIDGVAAGVTNKYAYIGTTTIPFTNQTDSTSTNTWITTIHNSSYFLAWKNINTYNEFVIFDKEGTVINRYTLQNGLLWYDGSITILGKDLSAAYVANGKVTDYYVIGFDDEDVRRRIMFFYSTDGDMMFIRGIGCIGANGTAYGEPIPCLDSYLEPSTNLQEGAVLKTTNTERKWYIGNKTSSESKFSTYAGYMPDITRYTNYYTILPNGVISLWNGPAYPNYTLQVVNAGTKLIDQICNENAALGSSLEGTSGTQSGYGHGRDTWHWKLHCHQFTGGKLNSSGRTRTTPYTGTLTLESIYYKWEDDDGSYHDIILQVGSNHWTNVYYSSSDTYWNNPNATESDIYWEGDEEDRTVRWYNINTSNRTIPSVNVNMSIPDGQISTGVGINYALYGFAIDNIGGPFRVDDDGVCVLRSGYRIVTCTCTGINTPDDIKGQTPYLLQEANEGSFGYDPYEPSIVKPSEGGRYQYSQDGMSEEEYYTSVNGNTIHWRYIYNFDNGTNIYTGTNQYDISANQAIDFLMQDNGTAQSGSHITYLLGDWTYTYDSMKSAANTTDYDGIFPNMRLFFNNASARNKYWEYDNTHSKFFVTPYFFACAEEELLYGRFAQTIVNDTYWNTGRIQLSTVSNLQNYNKIDSLINTSFTDCLGNAYHIGNDQSHNVNKPWLNRYKHFSCSNNKLSDGGNDQHVPYSGWSYNNYRWNDHDWEYATPAFHPLKIRGDGQGVFEETFAIGGMGENSVLDSLNYPTVANGLNSFVKTSDLTITDDTARYLNYDYRYDSDLAETYVQNNTTYVMPHNQLLAVNYSGLQIGLSFLNTLIFNADSMDNKWHYYQDTNGDIHLTIYNGKRSQSCRIQKGGKIIIDKLTDYMYRVNVLGGKNLLQETRNGTFSFTESFKAYLQDSIIKAIDLDLTYGTDGTASNSLFYYANGINADLNDEDTSPSFLMPQLTINTYVAPGDIDKYNANVLKNKKPIIRQLLKRTNEKEAIDIYYTNSVISTDCSYQETDKLPSLFNRTQQESYIGVQSFDSDKDGSTYWISDDPLYPTAIASEVSGVNYASSTIELPNNYAVRYYTRNNHTYNVYNQNAKVWYGQNIFTIMGSNYYFDGQGVYYIGSTSSGSSAQYQDNTLIAYAIGMRYLCNAPSEAYFYSPFDKCLYIFTASNTMQKSTSLERFGDVLDSCYCPVNQSLYLLFDGKLIVKTQDDMALFDVEGDRLYTTSEGVQVVSDEGYKLHHPYKFEDYEDLYIETEWLGNNQNLTNYSFAFVTLFSPEPITADVDYDYLTIQDTEVKHNEKSIHIKKDDWDNGFFRFKANPNDNTGNAFKLIIHSKDKLGVYDITNHQASLPAVNVSRT